MILDDDTTMSDEEILWAYNQYLRYLEMVDRQELELQKQHEMEMNDALLGV